MKQLIITILLIGFISLSNAQAPDAILSTSMAHALRVYIDCHRCDLDYIRINIPYVNFVREPHQADVHVLITERQTGGGGREYTFAFIGQQSFLGLNDTLLVFTQKDDTQDIVRKEFVKRLSAGFVRYIIRTPLADVISIAHSLKEVKTEFKDPWNFWVFSVRASTEIDGRRYEGATQLNGALTASHTSEAWKVRFAFDQEYEENYYKYTDDGEEITRKFISRQINLESDGVHSLDDHWSLGFSGDLHSATYNNIRLSGRLSPALEYNVFPYSESTHRQLRIQYRIGVSHTAYFDTTIYGKLSEYLGSQSVNVVLEVRQPWGSTSTSMSGSHQLHDLQKFNLRFATNLSIRLFEGISFDLRARYQSIRDQLSLPKAGATPEEVLTRQRQLATNYSYYFSFGLRYTFGSIYNNVVNPRFGGDW